jgi:hypothetical protein
MVLSKKLCLSCIACANLPCTSTKTRALFLVVSINLPSYEKTGQSLMDSARWIISFGNMESTSQPDLFIFSRLIFGFPK